MADIALNSAVRSNLRTLQSTTDLMNRTEERLSTGKKVNSALDNPSNFFTSQALDRRSKDLGSLLDSVRSSIQTLEAADNGIKAITDVAESLKATARAALQSPNAFDKKASSTTLAAAGTVKADDLTNTGSGTPNALSTRTISVNNERIGGGAKVFTIGTAANQYNTLDTLNEALAAVGMSAQIVNGELTLDTANAYASQPITAVGTAATDEIILTGTAVGTISGTPTFNGPGAVQRNNFLDDYNAALKQITTLANDASYNGVNLLNGDDLEVVFNEDGSSKLDVLGIEFDFEGIGLGNLTAADFRDSSKINAVIDKIDNAFKVLEAQSSKFGSQLQIVQTRETFTKDMIGTLEDGSLALTSADTNEEAANLATLQTRQQLIVSSLSISTQQESAVLQLLR